MIKSNKKLIYKKLSRPMLTRPTYEMGITSQKSWTNHKAHGPIHQHQKILKKKQKQVNKSMSNDKNRKKIYSKKDFKYTKLKPGKALKLVNWVMRINQIKGKNNHKEKYLIINK